MKKEQDIFFEEIDRAPEEHKQVGPTIADSFEDQFGVPQILDLSTDALARAQEERPDQAGSFGQIVAFPDGETMVVFSD